jgi:Flp pilus assembly protein TadG
MSGSRLRPTVGHGDDEGAVAVLVAGFTVIALVLLAFVVDRGMVYYTQAGLQNAVDAAALAGAHDLCTGTLTGAQGVATTYAQANIPTNWNATVNVPLPQKVSGYYYINVRATRPIASFFGGLAGVDGVAVAAQATATADCAKKKQYTIVSGGNITFNGVGNQGATVYGGVYAKGKIESKGGDTTVWADAGKSAPGLVSATNGTLNVVGDIAPSASVPSMSAQDFANVSGLQAAIDGFVTSGNRNESNCSNITNSWLTNPVRKDFAAITCTGDATISGDLSADVQTKLIRTYGALDMTAVVTHNPIIFFAVKEPVKVKGITAINGTIFSPIQMMTFDGGGGGKFSITNGQLVVNELTINGAGGTSITGVPETSPWGLPGWSLTK